tara:strand:- start:8 stop:124 length:117 start_codon:yes stop_codon:yes gene_type:complete
MGILKNNCLLLFRLNKNKDIVFYDLLEVIIYFIEKYFY